MNMSITKTTAVQLDIDGGEESGIKKIDGRTKAARAAKVAKAAQAEQTETAGVQSGMAPARPAARSPTREHAGRQLNRSPSRGSAQVLGRDGEVLTRTATDDKGDEFHVPPELIPEGWAYQWNTVSVIGNSEVALKHMHRMYANGWRPVPAERHPGRWTAIGHKGEIVVDGLRLEERPLVLSEEAAEQDQRRAKQQITDRDQSLMGGKANLRGAMRDGFAMGGRYRGTGGDVRMTIDPALDIPTPSHTLAEPGE